MRAWFDTTGGLMIFLTFCFLLLKCTSELELYQTRTEPIKEPLHCSMTSSKWCKMMHIGTVAKGRHESLFTQINICIHFSHPACPVHHFHAETTFRSICMTFHIRTIMVTKAVFSFENGFSTSDSDNSQLIQIMTRNFRFALHLCNQHFWF